MKGCGRPNDPQECDISVFFSSTSRAASSCWAAPRGWANNLFRVQAFLEIHCDMHGRLVQRVRRCIRRRFVDRPKYHTVSGVNQEDSSAISASSWTFMSGAIVIVEGRVRRLPRGFIARVRPGPERLIYSVSTASAFSGSSTTQTTPELVSRLARWRSSPLAIGMMYTVRVFN
jgi:hypothetical protein